MTAAAFWSKAAKTPTCWLWPSGAARGGYGKTTQNGRTVLAHRLAWVFAYGSVPGGLDVLHKCDVRRCVNPAHLFLGTQADNNADRDAKGRHWTPSGMAHYSARLDPPRGRGIRALATVGVSQAQLARWYGMSSGAIWCGVNGTTWRHVDTGVIVQGRLSCP